MSPRQPYLKDSIAGQIAQRFAYGSPSNLQGNSQFTLRKGRLRIHPTAYDEIEKSLIGAVPFKLECHCHTDIPVQIRPGVK